MDSFPPSATDYLMPYGILRRSDVADVVPLATEPGPVKLYPALKVEPQATVAEFDAQHPMSRIGGWWLTRASRRRRGSPRPCRCRSP